MEAALFLSPGGAPCHPAWHSRIETVVVLCPAMRRPGLCSRTLCSLLLLVAVVPLTSCSKKESASPPKPTPGSTQQPSHAAAPAATAPPPAQTPQAQPIASTDIDEPTPLAGKTVAGSGLKRVASYYYQFTANPGTITLTGTGKNESAASAFALIAALLDQ